MSDKKERDTERTPEETRALVYEALRAEPTGITIGTGGDSGETDMLVSMGPGRAGSLIGVRLDGTGYETDHDGTVIRQFTAEEVSARLAGDLDDDEG